MTQMPLTYQLVCAAPRTRGAGYDRNGTPWPLGPSIPSLLVPIPASERDKMPGGICQLNKSRRKPLLSSHIWSSLGAVAWPLHEPRADYFPAAQVNELVGLLPHSDQRWCPQRTEQYILLSCIWLGGLLHMSALSPYRWLWHKVEEKLAPLTFRKHPPDT